MFGVENLSIAWYALCKGNQSEAARPPPEGKKKPSNLMKGRWMSGGHPLSADRSGTKMVANVCYI